MATKEIEIPTRLIDVFADLFVLGPYLRDSRDLGTPDTLRARLQHLFHQAELRGIEALISKDTLTLARYPVAAFIDEMILNSYWEQKDQWASRPLQYEFFGEYVAGEGFFTRLSTLRRTMPVNLDLLEVFAMCLILGFEGQYKIQGRDELKGLTEEVLRELKAKRGDVPPLAPHAQRPEELMELVKRELPIWVVAVTSLGIVLFIYLALSWIVTRDADSVVNGLNQLLHEVRT